MPRAVYNATRNFQAVVFPFRYVGVVYYNPSLVLNSAYQRHI